MKKFLRRCFINSVSLALLIEIYPGLQITDRLKGILIAGLSLTIIDIVFNPILKTILLPINLLTLGALKWIMNVINVSLLNFLIPQVKISKFYFSGFSLGGIIIQAFNVSFLLSLIIGSVFLTLIKKGVLKIITSSSDD